MFASGSVIDDRLGRLLDGRRETRPLGLAGLADGACAERRDAVGEVRRELLEEIDLLAPERVALVRVDHEGAERLGPVEQRDRGTGHIAQGKRCLSPRARSWGRWRCPARTTVRPSRTEVPTGPSPARSDAT